MPYMTGSPGREDKELSEPFIVGVAGGTASGKTTVCDKIAAGLRTGIEDGDRFVLIPQDSFYRNLTPKEAANVGAYNFDHPDAFAFDEMVACLRALKMGQPVSIPMYDYTANARKDECTHVKYADVVLFDGILAFHSKELTDLMDLKVFVDVDSDTRLARRVRRDIVHRGRDVIKILDQYEQTVKPSHDAFVYPTRATADIIVPRGAENQPAIDLVLQLLKSKLAARSAAREEGRCPS